MVAKIAYIISVIGVGGLVIILIYQQSIIRNLKNQLTQKWQIGEMKEIIIENSRDMTTVEKEDYNKAIMEMIKEQSKKINIKEINKEIYEQESIEYKGVEIKEEE